MRRATLLIFAYALTSSAADAADPKKLFGLTGTTVTVRLSDDSKKCGLQEDQLKESVLLPIRAYTKLEQSEQSELVLSVSSAESNPGWCVHALTAQVTTPVVVRLTYQAEVTQQRVLLWSHYVVAAAPLKEPSYITDTAEELGKQFALAWQRTNAQPVTGRQLPDPFEKAPPAPVQNQD